MCLIMIWQGKMDTEGQTYTKGTIYKAVLGIRIRSNPDLFAGSGSGNFSPDPDPDPGSGSDPPKGAYYYQKR
jgi:hypothetical protein